MALSYRRKVRLAVLAALSGGFNQALADIASDYGVNDSAFLINFTADGTSTNFVQSHIDAESLEQIENSDLLTFPAIALYTHTVRDQPEFQRSFMFSGQVTAVIELIYRVRTGIDPPNTEDITDAFEAAVLTVLNDNNFPWSDYGVMFGKSTDARPASIVPLSDGWHHVTRIETLFNVVTN